MFPMFDSAAPARTAVPIARASWRVSRFPRFSPESERAFRSEFVAAGQRHKFELWLILLVLAAVLALFHRYYLTDPDTSPVVVPLIVFALVIPAVLRWLSSSYQPWLRWSTALFVISVYIDLACLMVIRAISIAGGHDVIPILLPVAVLAALLVVNVRFAVLLPTVLAGWAGIVVVELIAIPVDSNRLFNLVASTGILLVPLLSTYELERLNRLAWQQKQDLARYSRTDSLTALPNRRAFTEAITADLADRTDRYAPIAVALIDLDGFKDLNDTFGHPAGDRTLAAIGRYLLESSAAHGNGGEMIARLSGEEFVVYWPDPDTATSRRRAEALRAGIGGLRGGLPTPVTASAGFVCRTVDDDPEIAVRQLLACADAALYTAKNGGRDRLIEHTGPVPAGIVDKPRGATDPVGAPSHDDAQWSGTLRFTPAAETRFLEHYRRTGLPLRRAITGGVLAISAVIFVIQESVLQIPADASGVGRMFLAAGIMPAAAVGLATTFVRRTQAWSSYVYIGAIATVVAAQMLQRVIQLPKGYDVVPFLMPLAVLLSLGLAQLHFRALAPALMAMLTGVVVTEALAFPITPFAVLVLGAAVLMAAVVLRFTYRLELASREDWLRAQRLYHLARRDTLTALPNRRAFTDDLAATRAGGLLLLDVDHLKAYNDRYGHAAGDSYLVAVGQAITAATGPDDTVYRVGGDEFATLLAGHGRAEVCARAETVIAAVRTVRMTTGDDGLPASASAGLTLLGPSLEVPQDVDGLIRAADQALYRAKEQGRDRVVIGEVRSSGPQDRSGLRTRPPV